MEEIGIVIGIEGHMARVLVEKRGICEHCSAGTCHLTESGAEIDALNEAKASVGQRVRVTLTPYTYLKGSLIVYGIPVMALIAGAIAGKEFFAEKFPAMDPEGVSAIFGFGALFVSLIFVKLWSTRAGKKTEYKPVVEEIIQ